MMTTNATTARLSVLGRLLQLRTDWKGDVEDILDMYLDAIAEFKDVDVEAGYYLLVTGRVPTYQGANCPGPPQVALGCRMAEAQRLDHERRMYPPRNPALSRLVEKSPESKARIAKFIGTNDRSVLM